MINKLRFYFEYLFAFPKLTLFVSSLSISLFVMTFSFLGIDDTTHILNNPFLNNVSGLIEFWKNDFFGLYIPVTYSFWWGWEKIFGIQSYAFHLLNALAHGLNAYLFYVFLLRLKVDGKRSLLTALFFVFYPTQAASVAWISEFRGILSGTFSLLFLIEIVKPSKNILLFTLKCILYFLFALLSKPSAAVLPLLGILFLYFGRDLNKRTGIVCLILLLLSLLIINKTQDSQATFGLELAWSEKIILIFNNLGFYVLTLILPVDLSLDYGLTINQMSVFQLKYFSVALFFILFLICCFRYKKFRFAKLPILALIISILPVIGVYAFGYQYYNTVADRYLYFPVVFYLLLWINMLRYEVAWVHFLEIIFLIVPFFISAAWPYRNTQSLASHMISTNSKSFMGYTLRGESFIDFARFDMAEKDLLKAIEIKPDYWTAHSQYGELLEIQKRWSDSVRHFTAIVSNEGNRYQIIGKDNLGEFYLRIGLAYSNLGNQELGVKNLEMGRVLAPQKYNELINSVNK